MSNQRLKEGFDNISREWLAVLWDSWPS